METNPFFLFLGLTGSACIGHMYPNSKIRIERTLFSPTGFSISSNGILGAIKKHDFIHLTSTGLEMQINSNVFRNKDNYFV